MKNGLPFNILVVEDDSDDREIIDDAFKEIGYEAEVKKFIDGQSLLKYMEQGNESIYPSLIVLDNSLPGLDVQHLLSTLKNDDRYKAIPVIIYSGSVSTVKKKELIEIGALAIIEKGNTMQEIVKVAQQLKDIAESQGTHSKQSNS